MKKGTISQKANVRGELAMQSGTLFTNDTSFAELEEAVAEAVDRELAQMVNGDSFKKAVAKVIDLKLQAALRGLPVKSHHAGPGRGKISEKRYQKVSVSLHPEIYEEVRSLGGLLSGHISASLRLYLRAIKDGSCAERSLISGESEIL